MAYTNQEDSCRDTSCASMIRTIGRRDGKHEGASARVVPARAWLLRVPVGVKQ